MLRRKVALIYLIGLIHFFCLAKLNAQNISPIFFGQNAWMPDSIGSVKYYGQLHSKWSEIKNSAAGVIRFGGIAADQNKPTDYQYIQMIDSIRNKGMEPIIQVSFSNYKYNATQASQLVNYINKIKMKNIKYWIIGNEPDHVYKFSSSSQIAPYLRSFSMAMKDVDSEIKIIGPECAWYNPGILNGLTTPGGVDDVSGKDSKGRFILDYISFHTYPFNGSQSRDQVISYLNSPGKFNDNLISLNSRLKSCNSFHNRTGVSALKIAVTEANINYQNSSADNLNGYGAMSFIGGQFWAEMMAVALKNEVEIFNFWSVVEGNNTALNIGYIDKFNGKMQPTYYHFKLMAENFKGVFCNGTDNQPDIKAFGSRDNSQISVLILNQNLSSNFNYTLRLNSNPVSGNNALKINIDALVDKEYTDVINSQTTCLLVFDLAGNLLKKCEYGLLNQASKNLPPSCIQYSVLTNPVVTLKINAQSSTNICAGEKVVLNSEINTAASFQWKKNGIIINGATNSSFIASESGQYQLEATVSGKIYTSNIILVQVNSLPIAEVSALGSLSLCNGSSVLLQAKAVNGYTYQWKKDGINLNGAISSNYTANLAGNYQVEVTSGNCRVVSKSTWVSVLPNVTASISSSGPLSFCAGSSVTLNANTGGAYQYKWRKDGVVITGATAATYQANTSGNYQVEVSSLSCSAISNAVSVNANAQISATITASGPLSFCSGSSVLLSSNTGVGYLYQWKKDGVNILGATSSSYRAFGTGSYQVKIISGNCVAWSAPVKVSLITDFKAIINPPSSTSFPLGTGVLLTCNSGVNYLYQWKKDGFSISGANASTYMATSSGDYQVKIMYGTCVAWSAPLKLTAYQAAFRDVNFDNQENNTLNNGSENFEKTDNTMKVNVFPNPSAGRVHLNINFQENNQDPILIEVINGIGQTIFSKSLLNSTNAIDEIIEFDKQQGNGIYFLKVQRGNQIWDDKIILIR